MALAWLISVIHAGMSSCFKRFGFKFINIISDLLQIVIWWVLGLINKSTTTTSLFQIKYSLQSLCPHKQTNESQFKKTRSPKLKTLQFYSVCDQTVNLEIDAKTLYHSLLKLKYSRSIYLEHKKTKINIFFKIYLFILTNNKLNTSKKWQKKEKTTTQKQNKTKNKTNKKTRKKTTHTYQLRGEQQAKSK